MDMRAIIAESKAKGKKGKRRGKKARREAAAAAAAADTFRVDVADPRFAGMYEDPRFHVDPSNPQFKETKAMSALLTERHRRRRAHRSASTDATQPAGAPTTQQGGELASLVSKLREKLPQKKLPQRSALPAREASPAVAAASKSGKKQKKRKHKSKKQKA